MNKVFSLKAIKQLYANEKFDVTFHGVRFPITLFVRNLNLKEIKKKYFNEIYES